MKVLLISVDGQKPNLPLMKISGLHKKRGDSVDLRKCFSGMLGLPHPDPDKVYVSCIFSQNRSLALSVANMFNCEVEIGGYGVNDKQLPYDIEHQMPDYSLYGIEYSIGFTSRGCIRKCPWCIVPQKEGMIRDHAPIDEFYVPKWHKLILWDNNFLASPKWENNLHEIIVRKIRICFNQGLDIRLIDASTANLLSKTHYCDDQFKRPRLYFSFDLPNIEAEVVEGIEVLKKAGIKTQHLMFYVLVGYPYKQCRNKNLYGKSDYGNARKGAGNEGGTTRTLSDEGSPAKRKTQYVVIRPSATETNKRIGSQGCGDCNECFLNAWHRFDVLDKLGVKPYIMLYNDRKDLPVLRHFRRWVNRRYYKVCKFEDYKPLKKK